MTRDDARQAIVSLWREWRHDQPPQRLADRAKFYVWLRRHRPDLLAFRGPFDKRLHVSGWLLTDDHFRRARRAPGRSTSAIR